MRLLPSSLFSRLVLVLLGGLVVAQLVSFAIHMHERGELLYQASGMQAAQRIADTVKLLDTVAPAERRRIVQVLSAPPLAVTLDETRLAAQPEDTSGITRGAFFGAMLRRILGDDRAVVVRVAEGAAAPFAGAMHGAGKSYGWGAKGGMHQAQSARFSFIAQVSLRDGTLVTFNARQPVETGTWPYRLLASVAVLLAAVLAVSWIAVRWATRPLNDLADAAEELGRDIDRPPLAEKGPLEVARAARAFNTMQSRLAAYIRERTRILAAMSHDLKTPVTRLRLRSEMLQDEGLRARFVRDLDEMEAMVGSTLDFLRGLETGEPLQPVDVVALLESLQADMQEAGAQVEVGEASARPYRGRPQALKRCFGNLLENAVKHGGRARVLVDDSDKRLEVRIQDEGPGLPREELERVFEPYYRVEGSRSRETGGTGLGLTIARSVAESHGGRIVLCNRAEGGLEAVLTFPRQAMEPQAGRARPG